MSNVHKLTIKLKVSPILTADSLFFMTLFLYAMHALLTRSMFYYDEVLSREFFRLLNYTILLLSVFKIILSSYKAKTLVMMALICLITFVSSISSDRRSLLLTVVFIMSSYKVDFRKIVKWDLIFMLFWGIIIVYSGLTGVIRNKYYINRGYCYGFYYFSQLQFLVYAICGVILFLKRNCSYLTLFIMITINYILYMLCGSRTPFYIVIMLILGYLICEKWHLFSFSKKIWNWIAIWLFPGAYFFVYLFILLFQKGAFQKLEGSSLWGTMILRLRYSFNGIQSSGIHFWGSNYDMNSKTTFLDSGYIASLIIYGILFTILLMILYAMVFNLIYEKKSKFLYIWMLTCFVACFSTNLLLNPIENPVMFLMPYAIENALYRRREINL